MVKRVVASVRARLMIDRLREQHGDLVLQLAGGWGEPNTVICTLDGELPLDPALVWIGEIAGCPFYIDGGQRRYWQHVQLILDVAEPAQGGEQSLAPEYGPGFIARSRRFSTEEWTILSTQACPPGLATEAMALAA
ncbi:MAG TPA: DUF779 domain-containing protein [Rhodocyclaceae bacterium]